MSSEALYLRRSVEGGRIERQEVRVHGDNVSASFPDQPIGTVANFGVKRLPEYLTSQFKAGWHPEGPSLGLSTRYAIGEAVKEGFTVEQIAEAVCESKASLLVKGKGVSYAIRTSSAFVFEGEVNARWSDLSRLNRGLVMWFLATLRSKYQRA